MAQAKIVDRQVAKDLAQLVLRFNECTRVRNEFNHCMYAINERGEISHTYSMKMQGKRGQQKLGSKRNMDEIRIREMVDISTELKSLNRDIWDFLPRLNEYMAQRRREVRQRAKAQRGSESDPAR